MKAYVPGYGCCPKCGHEKGIIRERRPNGNTVCADCGPSPSRDWVLLPPQKP